jgi:hypothetical protein
LDAFGDTFEAGLKGRGLHDSLVFGYTVHIAVAFGTAGPKFLAEEKIADSGGA